MHGMSDDLDVKIQKITVRERSASISYSILAAFCLSRIACSAFVYFGHSQRPFLSPVIGGWEGIPHWWLNPWTTYDSEWYIRIALHGYDTQSTGFFPLYPWLLRIFSRDQQFMAWAGVAISHLAFLVALFLVFRLTELEWDRRTAHLTVWLLAFTPAAPFWGAVYTESVFLMLLVATFLAARTEKWWLAGCLGVLAALCRNPGFLIAGALLLEGVHRRQQNDSWGRRLAWVLPLAAFIGVQASLWWSFNNPLAGATAHFYRELDWPWVPIIRDIESLITNTYAPSFFIKTASGLIFTLTGLLLPLLGWNKIRPGYLLIVGGITLMNLTYAYQLPPQTISATRYMAPLFPVAQSLALVLGQNISTRKTLIVIGCWLYLFIIFSYMFGQKSYLG